MPKSRQRKGHRQKVEKRNQKIKTDFERAQKIAWEKFEQQKIKQGEINPETKINAD